MADLVERLRTGMGGTGVNAVMQEAADEIERLRKIIRQRKAHRDGRVPMRQYEIVVKVGASPSPCGKGLLWDSIKSYYRDGLNAARTKRDEEQRKNRDAVIYIRDVETMQLAG